MKKTNNTYVISFIKKFNTVFWGMISIVFLNRYLGPELKGEYTYVTNLLSILIVVFGLGISTVYPMYKRKNNKQYFYIFKNIVLLQFFIYFIFGLIMFFITDNLAIKALCILTPICILGSELGYINLVEDFKFNSIVAIISAVINAVLLLAAFLFLEKSLIVVYIIYGIKEGIISVLTLISINIRKKEKTIKISNKEKLIIVMSGIIPMLTNLLIVINYRVDVLMLKWQNVSTYLIGLYSVGVSLAEYAWIIPDIFKEVIINKTAKNDSLEDVKFSIRISSTILLIGFIFVIVLGKFLIELLFGIDYSQAYKVTIIIFTGIYSMMYCKIIGALFIAQGRQKFYFTTLLIGTGTNVILNYFTIPKYNIYGAALVSTISYSVIGAILLLSFKKKYNIKYKEIIIINKNDIKKIYKKIFKNKDIVSNKLN